MQLMNEVGPKCFPFRNKSQGLQQLKIKKNAIQIDFLVKFLLQNNRHIWLDMILKMLKERDLGREERFQSFIVSLFDFKFYMAISWHFKVQTLCFVSVTGLYFLNLIIRRLRAFQNEHQQKSATSNAATHNNGNPLHKYIHS